MMSSVGMKQSKFRHIEGSTMHRSLHVDNVRNISQSIPGESDGFHVNPKYCAVPMSGSAGLVAVIRVISSLNYGQCFVCI